MDWLVEIGEWVLNLIPRLFNFVWAILCAPVYAIMSVCYNAFIALPQLDVLGSDELEGIYNRITMVLIIVMAFYITFEIVKYVVQPEIITDKEKGAGNLTVRIALVIVMIAFVPDIFSLANKLQARVISADLISKVILGTNNNKDDDRWLSTAGGDFSADVFSLFYTLNTNACPVDDNGTLLAGADSLCKTAQKTIDDTINGFKNYPINGTISAISGLLQTFVEIEVDSDGDGKTDSYESLIEFNGLLALGVGIYMLWTLLVYGVELARRYFQLIFLQIISPIAIISYLSPKKDGTFQKWVRQCITTYIDVFIRLAIINFVLLILSKLHTLFFNSNTFIKNGFTIFSLVKYNPITLTLLYILIIIGLLNFAKKTPKMLTELFGSTNAASGSFGMSGKEAIESVKNIISGTSRVIGGTVGAYTGIKTARNSVHLQGTENKKDRRWSALKGAYAGAKAGYSKGGGITKARAAAYESVRKDEDIKIAGGNVLRAQFHGGTEVRVSQEQDRVVKKFEDFNKRKDGITSTADEVKYVKQLKTAWESAKSGGKSDVEIEAARTKYKRAQKAVLLGKTEYDATTKETFMLDGDGNRLFTIDTEDQARLQGTQDQIAHYKNEIDQDNGNPIEMLNSATGNMDPIATVIKELEIPIERKNPLTGKLEEVKVKVKDLKSEEFAANLGTIATIAEEHVKKIKRSKTYEEPHANAVAYGKGEK